MTNVLAPERVAALAAEAGFAGDDLAKAIAVAWAESSFDADARGDVALQSKVWGPSIGLMQIRSLNAQKGTGGERDEDANRDPAVNMSHAHAIFAKAGRFGPISPWSTYGRPKYLAYLPKAGQLAAAAGSSASSSSSSVTATPVSFVSNPFGWAAGSVRKLGVTTGAVGLGLLLLALGGARLAAPTIRRAQAATEQAAQVAATVA